MTYGDHWSRSEKFLAVLVCVAAVAVVAVALLYVYLPPEQVDERRAGGGRTAIAPVAPLSRKTTDQQTAPGPGGGADRPAPLPATGSQGPVEPPVTPPKSPEGPVGDSAQSAAAQRASGPSRVLVWSLFGVC